MRNFGIDPRHENYPHDDSPFIVQDGKKPISNLEFGCYVLCLVGLTLLVYWLGGLIFQW